VLSCAEYGKIFCIAESMVVYRRNVNGMSAKSPSLNKKIKHYQAIADSFEKKYIKICNKLIIDNIASYFLTGNFEEKKDAVRMICREPSYFFKFIVSAGSIILSVIKNKLKIF
jgi:hypothetical protein